MTLIPPFGGGRNLRRVTTCLLATCVVWFAVFDREKTLERFKCYIFSMEVKTAVCLFVLLRKDKERNCENEGVTLEVFRLHPTDHTPPWFCLNITNVIKSRKVKWEEHVTRILDVRKH